MAVSSDDDIFKLYSGRLDALERDIKQFHTEKEFKNDAMTIDDIWLKLDQPSTDIKKTETVNKTREPSTDDSRHKPSK